jgi:hypothetical protein
LARQFTLSPRNQNALTLFSYFAYVIGILWFLSVDAPYAFDVGLFGAITLLAVAQALFGKRNRFLIGLLAMTLFGLICAGFVPLAKREAAQERHIREMTGSPKPLPFKLFSSGP